MKKSEAFFGLLRIPVDAIAVSVSLILGYKLRVASVDLVPGVQLLEPPQSLPPLDVFMQNFVTPGTMLFFIIASFLGLYALVTTGSAWTEIGKTVLASLLWLIAVIAWFFLIEKQLFYSRILLLHATFFIALLTISGRVLVIIFQRTFLQVGWGVRNVISVGEQPIVDGAKQTLEGDVRYHYLGHVHTLQDLTELVENHQLDLVVQTDANPGNNETTNLIEYCRSEHIGYAFLPPVLADSPHQLRIDRLGLVPMLRFRPTPLDGWGRILKRLFDLVISGILLLLLSPLLILIDMAILLLSGWPIFYISKRVGQGGKKTIRVIKFRTMVRNADDLKKELMEQSHRDDGPLFKVKNDPRVTGIGKPLRRFSLDELPQLVNVLFGQMSLVGPRPHLPEEVLQYGAYERRVFAVKPGITGLSQVSGRSDLKFEEEVRLDLQYVEEWSPLLDLWILWRTVWVVLSKRGAD